MTAFPILTSRFRAAKRQILLIGALTLMGAAIRAAPVVGTSFPLNDGGLFGQMVLDLVNNGLALPHVTAYNASDIPFAYPPLGLYAAAIVSIWVPLVDVLRFVPLFVSILTIPVAWTIYRKLLPNEAMAVIATAAFALMPRSYDWQIAGGGITRSFGFFFALVAISCAISAYRSRDLGWAIASGLALGLAGLSHPQALVFGGVSVGLVSFAGSVGWKRSIVLLFMTLGIAAAIMLPWMALVVSRYGIATFLGAAQTGGDPIEAATLFFTFRYSDGLFEILGAIGAFGLFVSVVNRKWLWVSWAFITILVGSRAGLTYATIPICGAIAWGVFDAFRLLRQGAPSRTEDLFRGLRASALILVLLVVSVADALASPLQQASPLQPLTPEQLSGLDWVATQTAPEARFLVAAGEPWEVDAVSEWFWPITHRRSVATVQGTEWLGPGAFRQAEGRHQWVLNCVVFSQQDCAAEWSRVVERVDYVFLSDGEAAAASGHPCCLQLADRLMAAGGELVYSGEGVRIVSVAPLPPAVGGS